MGVEFKCSKGHRYALALIDCDKRHKCPFCSEEMNMFRFFDPRGTSEAIRETADRIRREAHDTRISIELNKPLRESKP